MAVSEVSVGFSKEFGVKTGATVKNKHQIQLKKSICFTALQAPEVFCKEGLQGLAQVFSCEYCEIFKNIYFEKHL